MRKIEQIMPINAIFALVLICYLGAVRQGTNQRMIYILAYKAQTFALG